MYNTNDREERIEIFNDTMRLCNTNAALRESINNSIASQSVIDETMEPKVGEEDVYRDTAKIVVSRKRSFEAAKNYPGKRVCVLNFASATSPGGGVKNGSSAQEECLCRCSTLYPCLNVCNEQFHRRHITMLKQGVMNALYNDDCVYTPGVTVFKTDTGTPVLMPEKEWYTVDVITCAAPNLRERPSNSMNPYGGSEKVVISYDKLCALHTRRANRILDIAKMNGAQVVILGAFGCGAFKNPPTVVANGIYDAVERHKRDFETIEFALYCTPNNTANYDAFARRFGNG